MQSAETVLDVIRRRGERGQPVKRLYRQLFNPQLYLMAYGRIHSNQGAMTPGVTGETVDGMSLAKIEAIIDDLRHERHRWSPVKRVYILKKNGKKRPLGMPTWTDKLIAVHHIRKLADLDRYGRKEKPAWIKLMAKRRRKTIVVCRKCHTDIHAGRLTVAIRK
jgi:hypothetical protein